jgi:hypothetical protein
MSSLPHPGRGEIPDGSPRAICIASSASQKEGQVKDPQEALAVWGILNACLREQGNSSLSKANALI